MSRTRSHEGASIIFPREAITSFPAIKKSPPLTSRYLELPLDAGYSYSRRKHEHSGTWWRVCAFWSACCYPGFHCRYPFPCRLYPSPWRPREASPPTFAPCWRTRGRRSRPTWSSCEASARPSCIGLPTLPATTVPRTDTGLTKLSSRYDLDGSPR